MLPFITSPLKSHHCYCNHRLVHIQGGGDMYPLSGRSDLSKLYCKNCIWNGRACCGHFGKYYYSQSTIWPQQFKSLQCAKYSYPFPFHHLIWHLLKIQGLVIEIRSRCGWDFLNVVPWVHLLEFPLSQFEDSWTKETDDLSPTPQHTVVG